MLKTQYASGAADLFDKVTLDYNLPSKEHFYSLLPSLKGKYVLDAGCGEGSDMIHYSHKGAKCTGIDSSIEMTQKAQSKGLDVKCADFEKMPFANHSFDVVLSKYAIQTSQNVEKVLTEFGRVLKPGGLLQYLAVHPMRQFLERKKSSQNYFVSTVVDSVLFDAKLTVQEPTHTMNEYLNAQFFKDFELLNFVERDDFPASEKIGGQTYPCYLIVQARKK